MLAPSATVTTEAIFVIPGPSFSLQIRAVPAPTDTKPVAAAERPRALYYRYDGLPIGRQCDGV